MMKTTKKIIKVMGSQFIQDFVINGTDVTIRIGALARALYRYLASI